MKMHHVVVSVLFFVMFLQAAPAFSLPLDGFQELKSEHFVVRYMTSDQRDDVKKTLDRAEYYYDRISRDINYARYQGYWTWEGRAGIVLFPDPISFSRFTGQPSWSQGYASRESKFFNDRTIVSFSGQLNFFDEILPHELAHLMVWDYFDRNVPAVPIWFEEGVAQLQEVDKRAVVKEGLKGLVEAGNHIPFHVLKDLRPSELGDGPKVSVFYAESLSIVVFLIEKYGQAAFYRLFKELRDGASFDVALGRAYSGIIDSMAALEERWVKYILDQ